MNYKNIKKEAGMAYFNIQIEFFWVLRKPMTNDKTAGFGTRFEAGTYQIKRRELILHRDVRYQIRHSGRMVTLRKKVTKFVQTPG
jgi:hypothetical protein